MFIISKRPPGCANGSGDKRSTATQNLYTGGETKISGGGGGDDSDLVQYRSGFIMPGLSVLSVSGRLSGCVPSR